MFGLTILQFFGLFIFLCIIFAYIEIPDVNYTVNYPVFILSGKGRAGFIGTFLIWLIWIVVVLILLLLVSWMMLWVSTAIFAAFSFIGKFPLPLP